MSERDRAGPVRPAEGGERRGRPGPREPGAAGETAPGGPAGPERSGVVKRLDCPLCRRCGGAGIVHHSSEAECDAR